eukprot:scaffold25165_cov124-Isochrysis_galbana.AAC.1
MEVELNAHVQPAGAARCRGGVCLCVRGRSMFVTFSPGDVEPHVQRLGHGGRGSLDVTSSAPTDCVSEAAAPLSASVGRERGKGGTALLGSARQFCQSFYHANQWEAEVFLCLQCQSDDSGHRLVPAYTTKPAPSAPPPRARCARAGGKPSPVPSISGGGAERCVGKVQVTIVARLGMHRAAIPRGRGLHDSGRASGLSPGADETGSDTAGGDGCAARRAA